MDDSPNTDVLDEKRDRIRRERLEAVVRWAEYVRAEPPEVWSPQQNVVVDSQLESAQATGLDADHEQRVRTFAETATEERDS